MVTTQFAEALRNKLSEQDRIELAKALVQGTDHTVIEARVILAYVPTYEYDWEALNPIGTKTQQKSAKEWAQQLVGFLNQAHPTYQFQVEPGGKKYMKVSQYAHTSGPAGKSVHCFVGAEGAIFKAAGWKAPVTQIRGWVESVLSGAQKTDPYGGWLYAK